MPSRSLSDNKAHDRLTQAAELLGEEPGETTAGNTALQAARQGLRKLAFALLVINERAIQRESEDQQPGERYQPIGVDLKELGKTSAENLGRRRTPSQHR